MSPRPGKIAKIVTTLVLAAAGAVAAAAPAPWYQWRSKIEDSTVCAQFSPGPAWLAVRGPFQDGTCKKPGIVK